MKNKPVAVIIALALIIACFVPCFLRGNNGTEQYDVVVFGDSNMAGAYIEESVPVLLERISGLRVLTGAFGGTTMADTNSAGDPGYYYSFLSMEKLSECVAQRDFSLAYMSTLRGNFFEIPHYPRNVEGLSKVDWDSVKYIIIGYGANDYSAAVTVDNPENPYDIYTFGGALRTSVQNIRKSAPNAKIILLTPTYNRVAEPEDCLTHDFGAGLLADYVAVEIEIATELNVYVVDSFHESVIGPDNSDEYLIDGLHLNEKGSTIIAEQLYECMLSLDGE